MEHCPGKLNDQHENGEESGVLHFFLMKQARWKNYFSAWQSPSRELISSDPLYIPVTFKVKEQRKTSLQSCHSTYNIELP